MTAVNDGRRTCRSGAARRDRQRRDWDRRVLQAGRGWTRVRAAHRRRASVRL